MTSRQFFLQKNCRGQVWVETVIYTLIAFALIATSLAYVRPKIEEMQDKAIIEQTLAMMEDIDSIIASAVQGGAGNTRIIELSIKKGSLKIDGSENKIIFEIESRHIYTEPCTAEPCTEINIGNIVAVTKKQGKFNLITLTRSYTDYDIQYKGESGGQKTITKSSIPYKLSIENKGDSDTDTDNKVEINFYFI